MAPDPAGWIEHRIVHKVEWMPSLLPNQGIITECRSELYSLAGLQPSVVERMLYFLHLGYQVCDFD